MALEVKVFKEIKEYRAKVLFGMSWRQFFTAVVTIPLIAGVYFLVFVIAGENTGILAVMLVSIPGFAFGWLRPMGIDFEKYVGFWWRHFLGTKHYTYRGIDPLAVVGRGENNGGEAKEKARRSRKTRIAFEQAN